MSIQVKKVKIDAKDKVEITIHENVIIPPAIDGGDSKEITNEWPAKCSHKPHEDFKNELLKLRKYALEICEIDEKTKTQYKVTSMVISGSMELEQARVMFSLRKDIKKLGRPANITTPQILLYGEEYERAGELEEQVQRVIAEALLYVSGKTGENNGKEQLQLAFKFTMTKHAKAA